jgi:molybdopterin synthase sulfur carrier subunit
MNLRDASMARDGSDEARVEAEVNLCAALIRLYPEAPSRLTLPAGTVSELLDKLDAEWPGMAAKVRDESPAIRRHMNVFVDGERAKLTTELRPGARVFIITAVSGG